MGSNDARITDFERIFNSAPVSYIVVDTEFRIAGVTDTFLEAAGRKREDILGKVITDEFGDNPDNPDADGVEVLRGALQRVIDEKAGHELPVQRYDIKIGGEYVERHFKPLNEPVFGDDGEVQYVIHGVEDVTSSVLGN